MRLLLQRVKSASVSVDGQVISKIGPGLLGLVGISRDDSDLDADYITRKLLNLRLWDNAEGVAWRQDVKQIQGEILLVSQFTLYARLNKGNKPDYHLAMGPDPARIAYQSLVEKVGKAYQPERVKDGRFGAYMDVELINDGPITLFLESEEARHSFKQEPVKSAKGKKPQQQPQLEEKKESEQSKGEDQKLGLEEPLKEE